MFATMSDIQEQEVDPEAWVNEHGDILYRFALGRVRDPNVAEDLVQDTLLSAWKGRESFSGRSTERTWLVGILKHKIVDYYRKANREVSTDVLESVSIESNLALDTKGAWSGGLKEWISNPEQAYERKEFWDVLNACLSKLNGRQRSIFELRELQHQEAEAICSELDISPSNLWVLLHRARLQLKQCLTTNWLTPRGIKAEDLG